MQLGYTSGGVCRLCDDAALFQDVTMPVGALEMRAGTHGNLPQDVKTVQRLLNRIGPELGGQRGQGKLGQGLKVDGFCGPNTRAAIKTFQQKQFLESWPDVIVDPHGRTIMRLNQLAYPEVDPILLAKGHAALVPARLYLMKTISRTHFVQTQMTSTFGFGDHPSVAMFNENFHLDKSNNPLADIIRIRAIYQTMLGVCGYVPKGPNQKQSFGFMDSFRHDDQEPSVAYAYAKPGGYHTPGVSTKSKHEKTATRRDLIVLTRRLLDLNKPAITYVILHELGHYVGGLPRTNEHIDDRAYFHTQKQKYDQLKPEEAMTNADTFSQYAWQVNNNGKHFLPQEHKL